METASTPPRGPRRPSTSVLLDGGVFVLGLAVLAGVLHAWWSAGADPRLTTALALSLPLGWVLTRFPLMVTGVASGIHVPFSPVVLFYLLVVHRPRVALAAWVLTALPAYFVDRRPWQSRVFNTGSSILSGLLATLVVGSLAPAQPVDPRMLLAVLAGAGTYYATDTVLSAVSIAVERRRTLVSELVEPGALVGGGLFLLVAALGYLAGAVRQEMPEWVAALTLLPSMAVVVAAWAWRRAHQSRRQQRSLFEAAVRIHAATTVEELLRAVEAHGTSLVSSGSLEVRSRPPAEPEIGCELGDDPRRWLVAARPTSRHAEQFDAVALASLGSLTSAALLRVRLAAETERLALVDPLTGLANRRAFTTHLERGLADGAVVAVLFVDLDGFKAVNDTLGHAAGDELLAESARRLRRAAGVDGFVARLGGDEFAVVLPDLFPGAADDTAEAVVQTLRLPFLLEAGPATISASVGVTASAPGDDADALLSRADAAMYVAKRAGGGRSVLGV
ncbi:diguanylate cyclase domain-containing protein [Kineococcus sp. TBRC 1896]|uniref:Diguanylate cyclase domain-containing protein n=1 Tax=Kineococcus mangrovi TaxID=1660183 RepID=A0ABV4HYV9_9ACTN